MKNGPLLSWLCLAIFSPVLPDLFLAVSLAAPAAEQSRVRADAYERNILRDYTRNGLLTEAVFSAEGKRAGDLSCGRNAMLTAFYAAAEAFRFRATGEPAARDQLEKSLAALGTLARLTGVPHLPAVSFRRGSKLPAGWNRSADSTANGTANGTAWLAGGSQELRSFLLAVLFAGTALDASGLLKDAGQVLVDGYLLPVAREMKASGGLLGTQGRSELSEVSFSPVMKGVPLPLLAPLALFQVAWFGLTAKATGDRAWLEYAGELMDKKGYGRMIANNWRLHFGYKRDPRMDLFFLAFSPALRFLPQRTLLRRAMVEAWDEGKDLRPLSESDNAFLAMIRYGANHPLASRLREELDADYPESDRKPVLNILEEELRAFMRKNAWLYYRQMAPLTDCDLQLQHKHPLLLGRRYRNGFLWAENPCRYELRYLDPVLESAFPPPREPVPAARGGMVSLGSLAEIIMAENTYRPSATIVRYEGYPAVDYLLVHWMAAAGPSLSSPSE